MRDERPREHLCWAYDDLAEFRSRVLEFLADGVAAGERVCYVCTGERAAPWDGLDSLAGRNPAPGPDPVQLWYLADVDAVIDPDAYLRTVATETQDALAAGFTGLRVATDATPLVRTPAQLDAVARYEHLIDRYMTTAPFSALCAFDRAELGESTVAQLACLHPAAKPGTAPFRLHASHRAAVVELGGELDLASHELWSNALRWVDPRPTAGEVEIDARGLEFIDHRSLLTLAEHARRHHATAVLRSGSGHAAARIVEVLGLTGVRVVGTIAQPS